MNRVLKDFAQQNQIFLYESMLNEQGTSHFPKQSKLNRHTLN